MNIHRESRITDRSTPNIILITATVYEIQETANFTNFENLIDRCAVYTKFSGFIGYFVTLSKLQGCLTALY